MFDVYGMAHGHTIRRPIIIIIVIITDAFAYTESNLING